MYDAYFNYLPFEKAVIESNGKTPYTNKEVEQIVHMLKLPVPQLPKEITVEGP